MPTTYDEGDYATLKLDVPNTEATTEVRVMTTAPSGATYTPLVSREDDDTWWAQQLVDEPGLWQVRWIVDGDGQGVEGDMLRVRPSSVHVDPGARLYATTADLARFMGDVPPDDAIKVLTDASRDLDHVLVGARYRTDDDGMPVHPHTVKALRDATCAQAWFSMNGGSDQDAGLGAGVGAIGIGSINITAKGGSGSSSDNSTGGGSMRFSRAGLQVLHEAGLLPIRPFVNG